MDVGRDYEPRIAEAWSVPFSLQSCWRPNRWRSFFARGPLCSSASCTCSSRLSVLSTADTDVSCILSSNHELPSYVLTHARLSQYADRRAVIHPSRRRYYPWLVLSAILGEVGSRLLWCDASNLADALPRTNRQYAHKIKVLGRRPPPEEHLRRGIVGACLCCVSIFAFAWTAQPSVHWIVPMICTVPFGTGMLFSYQSVFIYLGKWELCSLRRASMTSSR